MRNTTNSTNNSSDSPFASFFMGGFECSTHRLASGRRLDLVGSTRHDVFAESDFRLLQEHGIYTVREGLRWHLIESVAGRYDFSSAQPIIRAARATGTQIIWDLWHYGWPDDLDLFSADFIERFVAFAQAVAELLSKEPQTLFISPVNEISFFSWAGGEAGIFFPFAQHRGGEMKRQLVRATVAAIRAIREVNPATRFCQIDPIIHVTAAKDRPSDQAAAEVQRQSQFEAWDMISGKRDPELGGSDDCLDIVGVNFYIHNQWIHPGGHGTLLPPSHPQHRPWRDVMREVYLRYQKPMFIAETGIEDASRPMWLRYVGNEHRAARAGGVDLHGICLYPIMNHPGWDDDRHCHNGLLDYPDDEGRREVYQPLAEEIARQQDLLKRDWKGESFAEDYKADASALDWAAHHMTELTDAARTAPAE